jgi:hypothetical protein
MHTMVMADTDTVAMDMEATAMGTVTTEVVLRKRGTGIF